MRCRLISPSLQCSILHYHVLTSYSLPNPTLLCPMAVLLLYSLTHILVLHYASFASQLTTISSPVSSLILHGPIYYILHMINSYVVDLNTRNKLLTQKLFKQGYRYHKLGKTFSLFYRRYYDLISKFQVGLKFLFPQGLSEPDFYGDLV